MSERVSAYLTIREIFPLPLSAIPTGELNTTLVPTPSTLLPEMPAFPAIVVTMPLRMLILRMIEFPVSACDGRQHKTQFYFKNTRIKHQKTHNERKVTNERNCNSFGSVEQRGRASPIAGTRSAPGGPTRRRGSPTPRDNFRETEYGSTRRITLLPESACGGGDG